MKEVRQLAGQTVIYGLGTIVPRFLNYGILTFFYTRLFEKAEYGVVTELYAWMVLFLVILTYGMETGFFRFAREKEDYERVYSTALISLLVTSVAFVILVNIFIKPFSGLLNYSDNQDYIRMFSVIISVDAFAAIPFARLRKENRAILFSTIKILNVIITLIAVLFLLLWAPVLYERDIEIIRRFYNPDYGVGYVFVANIIGSVSTMLIVLPFTLKFRPVFDRDVWLRMIGYSFPLMIAGLSGSINDTIDKVMLRRLIGEDDGLATVGEYGAGYKIGVLMALVIQMFRFAAEPYFFERAEKKDSKEAYAVVMKYFIIIMLVVFLFINLYRSGIQYILDSSYRDSLVVVPMISMGYLLYGIYVNHSIWYKLNDLTRFSIYITLSGAVITILINLIFIPAFGYMASAWAHVISYLAMIIISFRLARKYYYIDYNMVAIVPYFIVAVGMVIFAVTVKYNNLIIEIVLNTVLLISFLGFAQYRDKIFNVLFKRS